MKTNKCLDLGCTAKRYVCCCDKNDPVGLWQGVQI